MAHGLIALLLALAGVAAAAQDRVLLPERAQDDFAAVGRLNFGSGFCTAALIAPDLVATAAHCLFARTGRMRPSDRFHFVAGYRQGRHRGHGRAAALAVHAGFVPGAPVSLEAVAADLALIRLSAPLEGVAPIPLGAGLRPGGRVTVLSYGRNRPEIASSGFCRVEATQGGAALLDCDVTFGVSGAPVLRAGAEGWTLVGVISAKTASGAAAASAAGFAEIPPP